MSKKCVLYKNFYNYDPVIKKPKFPDCCVCVYLTDNVTSYNKAKQLDWDEVYMIDLDQGIKDPLERRKKVAYSMCYPEKLVPELNKFDYIFICDANLVKPDSNFIHFITDMDDKALHITSGWYKGSQNTLELELHRTLLNRRWTYNFGAIKNAYARYIKDYLINVKQCPAVSAKIMGWKLNHPKKSEIADFIYSETQKHLQGNIILSVVSEIWKDDVFHYKGLLYDGANCNHLLQY